ncbi:hypothetical protein EA658_09995 [Pseudoxanthomonas winnipegensis]|uniref:UrcA family protein n=1 Tax=Pseudoxanthomonas winnipegensis TaxID=2480810 RepID=A0ABY1WCT3_9GAMM|nr:hypothetical protein [Pseudoxanthomonas winnipegensis]TAA12438.1 hypothetical protein EA659_03655 [Pseudoxanthomonas winnipegensis]TAA19197.1 hypothetical protein EA658_09995 [Pseudoxanthomonas winnipegensis]TAH70458.1 hypothetical protein EA657_17060 [Pseudoxanthomonas winnipegensis]
MNCQRGTSSGIGSGRRSLISRYDLFFIAIFMAALVLSTALPAKAGQIDPMPITDARTCAAVSVYELGTAPEWEARAARALEVLSQADARGQVPDCRQAMNSAVKAGLSVTRWQVSLALVDAARGVLAEGKAAATCATDRATALAGGVR